MSPERIPPVYEDFGIDREGAENPKLTKYFQEHAQDIDEKFGDYEFNGIVKKGDPKFDEYRAAGTLAYGLVLNSGVPKEELNKMPIPELFRRAREIYDQNTPATASEFETPAEETIATVWYDGIINDLRKATDINIPLEKREPARDELRQHGINLGEYINEDPDKAENRFLMIRDATEILAGNYNQRTNRWGSKEAAINFMEDTFGIKKQENAPTETVPANIPERQQRREPEELTPEDLQIIEETGENPSVFRKELEALSERELSNVEKLKSIAISEFDRILQFEETQRILMPYNMILEGVIKEIMKHGAPVEAEKELRSLYRMMLISRAVMYMKQFEGTLWSSGFAGRYNDSKDQPWVTLLKNTGFSDEDFKTLVFGGTTPTENEGMLIDRKKINLALKYFLEKGQTPDSKGKYALSAGKTFSEINENCEGAIEALQQQGIGIFESRVAYMLYEYFFEGEFNSRHYAYSAIKPRDHIGGILNNAESLWWGGSTWMFKKAVASEDGEIGVDPLNEYPTITGDVRDYKVSGIPERMMLTLGDIVGRKSGDTVISLKDAVVAGNGLDFLRDYFIENKGKRPMFDWVTTLRTQQSLLNDFVSIGAKNPDTLRPEYLRVMRNKLMDNAVLDTGVAELSLIPAKEVTRMLRTGARIMFLETSAFMSGVDEKMRWDPERAWNEYLKFVASNQGSTYFDFAGEMLKRKVSGKNEVVSAILNPVIRESLTVESENVENQLKNLRKFVRRISNRYMENPVLSNDMRTRDIKRYKRAMRLIGKPDNYPTQPGRLEDLQYRGELTWGQDFDITGTPAIKRATFESGVKRKETERKMNEGLRKLGPLGKWLAGDEE